MLSGVNSNIGTGHKPHRLLLQPRLAAVVGFRSDILYTLPNSPVGSP